MSFVTHFSLCGKFSSLGQKKLRKKMITLVYYGATWCTFKAKLEKEKEKIYPEKNSYIFSGKSFSYILGNGTFQVLKIFLKIDS